MHCLYLSLSFFPAPKLLGCFSRVPWEGHTKNVVTGVHASLRNVERCLHRCQSTNLAVFRGQTCWCASGYNLRHFTACNAGSYHVYLSKKHSEKYSRFKNAFLFDQLTHTQKQMCFWILSSISSRYFHVFCLFHTFHNTLLLAAGRCRSNK